MLPYIAVVPVIYPTLISELIVHTVYRVLAGLHTAMEDGIDVRGYLHWSLLDNYEWGSFKPTFGLIAWDKETFERKPKPSLYWLGKIAQTNQVRPY